MVVAAADADALTPDARHVVDHRVRVDPAGSQVPLKLECLAISVPNFVAPAYISKCGAQEIKKARQQEKQVWMSCVPDVDIVAALHHIDELVFRSGAAVQQVGHRLVAHPPRVVWFHIRPDVLRWRRDLMEGGTYRAGTPCWHHAWRASD